MTVPVDCRLLRAAAPQTLHLRRPDRPPQATLRILRRRHSRCRPRRVAVQHRTVSEPFSYRSTASMPGHPHATLSLPPVPAATGVCRERIRIPLRPMVVAYRPARQVGDHEETGQRHEVIRPGSDLNSDAPEQRGNDSLADISQPLHDSISMESARRANVISSAWRDSSTWFAGGVRYSLGSVDPPIGNSMGTGIRISSYIQVYMIKICNLRTHTSSDTPNGTLNICFDSEANIQEH